MRPDKQPSISAEAYLAELGQLAQEMPVVPARTLPLADCLGRVLAQDVRAEVTLPPFANSAMDGYAIRAADSPGTLQIVGEQPAGLKRTLSVGTGQAVRIMTGAAVPDGADAVVQSELTFEEDNRVTVTEAVPVGANIRTPGEDVRQGEVVLEAGSRLGPRDLSAAAAIGVANLAVHKRLRVGVIATGDELARPGQPLAPGQIYESNSVLLSALVRDLGASVSVASAGDEPAALARTLDDLSSKVEVILLSGGVSVGKFDVVRNLLAELPQSRFTRVAIQPGKPQGYSRWNGTPLLAFPGNPVGAFVSFQLFGRPLLAALAGQTVAEAAGGSGRWGDRAGRCTKVGVAGAAWRSPRGRRQFVPVRIEESLPLVTVFPTSTRGSGSHLVATLVRAEVLAIVPEDVTEVAVGDELELMEIQ